MQKYLKDIRDGLALWLKITNVGYAVAQFIIFVVAEAMVVLLVAPRFYDGVKGIFLNENMDADGGILVLSAAHTFVFIIALKQIVYRAYGRNQDLFYQLAVSKRVGCVCTIVQQLGWYYYSVVVLSAICRNAIVPEWCVILAYTLLFLLIFGAYYESLGFHSRDCRPAAGVCKREKVLFKGWKRRSKGKRGNAFRGHPLLELFKITLCGLYQCKSLAVGKILLFLFIIVFGYAHVLGGTVFFLAVVFLILINDGYWRKESGNFQYFSSIGIPVSKYLWVHFLAGAGFNLMIPVLLFCGITGEVVLAAVLFAALVYFLIFWYLVQFYLYFTIGRDKEGAIMLCGAGFLAIAMVPPAGLAVMVWLYRRIMRKWKEEGCSQ